MKIFKYLISLLIITFGINGAEASTYASLSPVFTEIIYALDAQDNLLGVSSVCNYPKEAKQKPVIGDTYYVNAEMLVKLKPDYLFATESNKPKLGELYLTSTKPVYFNFFNINDIYNSVEQIGKITQRQDNAELLIKNIKNKIDKYKTKTPKKILFLIQTNPEITIGKNSFITDIIRKSGHKSITENINFPYPEISLEYALKNKPDVIIMAYPTDVSRLKRLFPNTKILYLSRYESDIIMRPGPRVYEAVKIFSEIDVPNNSY